MITDKKINPGDRLIATTGHGTEVAMRATSKPQLGRSGFMIVWVATELEYESALASGERPYEIPWPIKSLRLAGEAS